MTNDEEYAVFNFKQDWVLVVLLALVVLCPWPILGLSVKPKSSPDIIAVPSEGTTLMANVSPIFGRSPYYLIVDLKNNKTKVLVNPFAKEAHAVGLRMAHLILDEKAGVAIAKFIGPEPFNNLTERGVQVYLGDPKTVEDAIRQLQAGQLIRAEKPNVPTHFGLQQQNPTPASGQVL